MRTRLQPRQIALSAVPPVDETLSCAAGATGCPGEHNAEALTPGGRGRAWERSGRSQFPVHGESHGASGEPANSHRTYLWDKCATCEAAIGIALVLFTGLTELPILWLAQLFEVLR